MLSCGVTPKQGFLDTRFLGLHLTAHFLTSRDSPSLVPSVPRQDQMEHLLVEAVGGRDVGTMKGLPRTETSVPCCVASRLTAPHRQRLVILALPSLSPNLSIICSVTLGLVNYMQSKAHFIFTFLHHHLIAFKCVLRNSLMGENRKLHWIWNLRTQVESLAV